MKSIALTSFLLLGLGLALADAAPSLSSKSSRNSVQTKKSASKSSSQTFTATLTTYWAIGRGSDYWTRRFTSATGKRLVAGVSVAADPRIIPYGSIIEIEGVGRRVVKDTGSHVIQRVASRKRGVDFPVIDLFFASRQEAMVFARNHPPFAKVKIISRDA